MSKASREASRAAFLAGVAAPDYSQTYWVGAHVTEVTNRFWTRPAREGVVIGLGLDSPKVVRWDDGQEETIEWSKPIRNITAIDPMRLALAQRVPA